MMIVVADISFRSCIIVVDVFLYCDLTKISFCDSGNGNYYICMYTFFRETVTIISVFKVEQDGIVVAVLFAVVVDNVVAIVDVAVGVVLVFVLIIVDLDLGKGMKTPN